MTTDLCSNDISLRNASEQELPTAPSIWRLVLRDERIIVPLSAGINEPAIYCIHSIGGDLYGYDRLADAFGGKRRIYGVQVPKSMMREGAVPSIETMARRYTDALIRFQPNGPFVIAGYSAGAIIGLEIAQQLLALGKDVPLLVAFDGAPLMTQRSPLVRRLLLKAIWRLASLRPRDFRIANLRSRLEFRRIVEGENASCERKGERDAVCRIATRGGWSESQKRFIIETYQAMTAYAPAPYPGRLLLFEARSQPILQGLEYGDVWKTLTSQCEIVKVRARHSDFFESSNAVSKIAHHLEHVLSGLTNRAQ